VKVAFADFRRDQNAFLLPEGEGQDEGEGGMSVTGRIRTFQPQTSRLYPLPTLRNQMILLWVYHGHKSR